MFLIILVCLFAVSAVSAADNATNDIMSIDETNDKVTNIEDNLVILKEKNNIGTFTDLNTKINNNNESRIYLNNDYYYDVTSDLDFKDGITINRDISIYGNGFTISGENTARIFHVNNKYNVIFQDILFANGEATSVNSGAIDGYCKVINCTFTNNNAFYGGAMKYGDAYNCTFTNNNAGIGGAICDGNAYNCTFTNNNAIHGGAMGHSNAYNCTFTNNTANSASDEDYCEGGAMYYGDAYNCTFTNNNADYSGGAISNGNAYNCTFTNNNARAMYYGDAYNCTFTNNNAGAMADGNAYNCIFTNNSAYNGGAMYGDGYSANHCQFTENTARNSGGATYQITANNCNFTKNIAENNGGAMFGGVATNCIFKENIAGNEGNDTFNKPETQIISNDISVVYMDSSKLVAMLFNTKYGFLEGVIVIVNINGANYKLKTDSSGIVRLSTANLHPGNYIATISYAGNKYYSSATKKVNVVVNKANTIISSPDVNVSYKDPNGEMVATIINEYDKPLVVTLSVNLNGKTYTVKTNSSGQASIPIDTLTPGTYTATISYKGSSNYKASNTTVKVTVTKADTIISAPDVSVAYKDPSGELVAVITNEQGKPLAVNLNVNFNGVDYTVRTDSNGQASIPIDTLSPGKYTATISYKGSANYKASTTTAKITVTKASTVISVQDVSVAYKDPNGKLVTTITNEHGKPLVVNLNIELNGKTYTVRTDSNGQANIPIDTLTPGNYTATISYKGSANYKASTTTAKITVTKSDTIISAPDVSIAYKDPNGKLVTTITNEHEKPLVVNLNIELNGKTYTVRTDSNGQANIPIDTLTPGNYTATISYKGSANYKASTTTAKITVTKSDTAISAPDVSIAYKDPNGKLVATIVNEHNKPLVVNLNVNINGKDYTVRTDSNGQANIPIDTLTPRTYTATISYKGSNNYKATTTTAKVTVIKSTTVISAPDVSVAYKDPNGKLVSTITNEHGKPLVVTLNVNLNGKTFTAKTDSNGQISVSTADLAPGTYTATISYKGSNNYEATSTTANITVKQ